MILPFTLLALLAGLVAFLVGLIVSLFFGFLVMIVQIPAGCAGDRTHGHSNSGITRDCPNHPAGCSADGSATQGALFGIRHARASNERQADDQKYYNCVFSHGLLLPQKVIEYFRLNNEYLRATFGGSIFIWSPSFTLCPFR
jgi:hypothetical protein